jgi:hypothetical protein
MGDPPYPERSERPVAGAPGRVAVDAAAATAQGAVDRQRRCCRRAGGAANAGRIPGSRSQRAQVNAGSP